MAEEPINEERLIALENAIAALRRDFEAEKAERETEKLAQVKANELQSDVSSALIARTDDILVEHLKRLERMQLDGVSKIMAQLRLNEVRAQTTNSRLDNVEVRLDGIEANLIGASEILTNHKEALETLKEDVADIPEIKTIVQQLAEGQAQILAILTGEQKRND